MLLQAKKVQEESYRFNLWKEAFVRFCFSENIDAFKQTKSCSKASLVSVTNRKTGKKEREIVVYFQNTKRGFLSKKVSRLLTFIGMYFLVACLFSLARYFIITNKNRANAFLVSAAQMDVEWYNNMQCIHSSIMELFLLNNNSTIGFMQTLDFYYLHRRIVDKRVIGRMEELYNEDHGETTTYYRQWIDTNMREADKKTDENQQYFVGDTQAMAGIVNNTILNFAKKYVILCDQLVQEWKLCTTKKDRFDLLKKDQYHSILAFAVYNNLGTVDAVYYHIVYPLWTYLKLQIDKMPAFLSLVNIVSYSYAVALLIVALVFIVKPFSLMQQERDYILNCVPIRLMEESYHWKNVMKTARESSHFTFK